MRIRITKDQGSYKKGDIVEVSKNVAFGLIDSGVGVISKDITSDDLNKQEKSHGKSTFVRSHLSK